MANSSDIKDNPFPSILLVGDGGTHKTRFIGTVPGIEVIDHDNGMASVRDKAVTYHTIKDVPLSTPKRVNKERGLYPWGTGWRELIKRLDIIGEAIDKDQGPAAIGIDSLTTQSLICMNYVLKEDSKGEQNPGIQHWGAQMQLMERVMDQLTAWPVILVVTCHIQRNTNNVTEVVEQLPLLTGKLAGRIGIYFDEVWYMKVDSGGKPSLITQSSGMIKQAKSRYNVPNGTPANWQSVAPIFGIPVK